jgi:hypothetical protein
MGSNDSGNGKVDGFPNEEGDMSKKPKRKSEQAVTAGVDVQADRVIAILNDGEYFETDDVAIDPSRVDDEPVASKLRAIADDISQEAYQSVVDKLKSVVTGESTGPVPREDEARPCTLCESRRPIGKSYSRVYCTKAKVRYCRCSYCGHTWPQERK